MTPAARPILSTHYAGEPDYLVPTLISQNPQALALYQETMEKTFNTINQLLELGGAAGICALSPTKCFPYPLY